MRNVHVTGKKKKKKKKRKKKKRKKRKENTKKKKKKRNTGNVQRKGGGRIAVSVAPPKDARERASRFGPAYLNGCAGKKLLVHGPS